MTTNVKTTKKGFQVSAPIVILCCFVVAFLIYTFIFGKSTNFMDNDPANDPINILGTIHKGGFIVPIIQSLLLTVLVLSVERFIAIFRAQGKGKLVNFVENLKAALRANDMQKAMELCDKQQGTVANVVNAGLVKYAQMEKEAGMTREEKSLAIQKEIDAATTLELPSLEQNLPVIATMTTLGTLMGLLGTVMGMIKSFAALANSGTTDSIALSAGISEALVNTAFGIATGALAVISYNYFTTKIDGITHAIDEVGFTITQTFEANHK